MEPTKDLINWILAVIGTNITAIALTIISLIKTAKMMPKELKGSDLDNKSKEISIAEQYEDLATSAAQKVLNIQSRLDEVEQQYKEIKNSYDMLTVSNEELRKSYQALSIKISEQDAVIEQQQEEMDRLRFDLNSSQEYNRILIEEMKAKQIVPPEAPKRKYTKKTS